MNTQDTRLTGSAEDERVKYISSWRIFIEVELDGGLVTVRDDSNAGARGTIHVETADRQPSQLQDQAVRLLDASRQIQHEHDVQLNVATWTPFRNRR